MGYKKMDRNMTFADPTCPVFVFSQRRKTSIRISFANLINSCCFSYFIMIAYRFLVESGVQPGSQAGK